MPTHPAKLLCTDYASTHFYEHIDLAFTHMLSDRLSTLYSTPSSGHLSAGDVASTKAAAFPYQTFKQMGLSHVNMTPYETPRWTYKGAQLTFISMVFVSFVSVFANDEFPPSKGLQWSSIRGLEYRLKTGFNIGGTSPLPLTEDIR